MLDIFESVLVESFKVFLLVAIFVTVRSLWRADPLRPKLRALVSPKYIAVYVVLGAGSCLSLYLHALYSRS